MVRKHQALGFFEQATAAGRIRFPGCRREQRVVRAELDPFVLMWAFFGALDEIAMQWVLAKRRDKFSLEATADTVADVFIRGMAEGGSIAGLPATVPHTVE